MSNLDFDIRQKYLKIQSLLRQNYEEFFQFINVQILQAIDRHCDRQDVATIKGYALRLLAATNSLKKLDEPFDFQSTAHLARLTFELAIDLTYFSIAKQQNLTGDHAIQDLEFWESSAKLNLMEKELNALGTVDRIKQDWINNNKSSIDRERLKRGWIDKKNNKPQHRTHWTQRGDLAGDAKYLDILLNEKNKLEETYFRKIGMMNLHLHGSGITLVRELSTENVLSLWEHHSLVAILNIGHATEELLRFMNLWEDPIVQERVLDFHRKLIISQRELMSISK